MGFFDYLKPLGMGNPILGKYKNFGTDLLMGTPEKRENVSTLRPEQEGLYQQSINAGMGRGAGGAFGQSADYYRNNLSDDPADFDSFAAPQMRQFNEQTIPELSEQFAGMGSGGLSSSGFRNAAIGAGTDLSERLGAIRANLRQNSAQGLQNIGQVGLQNYSQNMVTEPGTKGLLAPGLGALGTAVLGPVGGALGSFAGNSAKGFLQNSFGENKVGANSSPDWKGSASPQIQSSSKASIPNVMQSQRGF